MSDSVANFPDVPDVQQKLPSVDPVSSNTTHSFIVPIVPLVSNSTFNGTKLNNNSSFNLQVSAMGGNGHFSVKGNTRPFLNNFKNLGGNWHKDISCWRFENSYFSEVTKFVAGVNDGTIKPERMVTTNNYKNKNRNNNTFTANTTSFVGGAGGFGNSDQTFPSLPTINGGQNQGQSNSDFQTVVYTGMFRPKVGMNASVKVKDQTKTFPVVEVKSSGQFVDSAKIDSGNGNLSELVIAKGKWMVWGLNEIHSVYFMK